MSIADGMAAINLEMPDRIPRTEYSAQNHWALIAAETGIEVNLNSSDEVKMRAQQAFMKAWSYDFNWSILISSDEFGEKRSHMGHAVYADGGTDYDQRQGLLFDDPEAALAFDPMTLYGKREESELIHAFNRHYDANCDYFADAVNMTGVYITCMSGFIEALGWETLLMAAGIDSKGFGECATRYCRWMLSYFEALAKSKTPVVMIHDDIVWTEGAFLHPDWYRTYLFPNYKKMFQPLLDSGKKIIFTSDGNYTEFVSDLVSCGVHGFVLEPCTDLKAIADAYGQSHVIIGNADTRILLYGDKPAIRAEVERCMNIGRRCPGFFMAVGNHIPANTPVENAQYYNQVYQELSKR